MPELPEVETISKQLRREIKGATINEVVVYFGKRLSPRPNQFVKSVKGRRIKDVTRRAKLISIKLSGGLNLIVHLKLTGRLILKRPGTKPTKHTHIIFKLSGGRELHFEDMRKFGFIKLFDDAGAERYISEQKYGPEALAQSFTVKVMADCLRKRPSTKIKPLLMEQKCIAGIGNIYATEALWFSKIHPLTPVKRINNVKMRLLYRGLIDVLKRALKAGGTSDDAYLDAYGRPGRFVPQLKAYGREGEKCYRCGARIAKMKIAGRGSAFCPRCQKLT